MAYKCQGVYHALVRASIFSQLNDQSMCVWVGTRIFSANSIRQVPTAIAIMALGTRALK